MATSHSDNLDILSDTSDYILLEQELEQDIPFSDHDIPLLEPDYLESSDIIYKTLMCNDSYFDPYKYIYSIEQGTDSHIIIDSPIPFTDMEYNSFTKECTVDEYDPFLKYNHPLEEYNPFLETEPTYLQKEDFSTLQVEYKPLSQTIPKKKKKVSKQNQSYPIYEKPITRSQAKLLNSTNVPIKETTEPVSNDTKKKNTKRIKKNKSIVSGTDTFVIDKRVTRSQTKKIEKRMTRSQMIQK
jgi:hypothetical protein